MGDRDNPIKFGPEWLRNLAGERGAGSTGGPGSSHTHSQSSAPGPSGGAGPGTRRTGASGDSFAGASASSSSNGTVGVRVQLANLRYGREEMLALYEAAADPPQELTNNEILYQPRSKLPFALSTSFDDEMRENLRSSPHTGGVPGDRFGLGRGAGRGLPLVADNPRPRFRTTGSTVLNRPRNLPLTTGGHFSGDSQDSGVRPQLGQRSTRYQSTSEHKPVFYPNYVGANNMFRSKRQTNTTSTNWRSSQTRDSGEEWRSAEPGRARTGQDRERDRERPSDRPTSSSHRRSTSDHNDETIPEWAFANAEACGGTFDSLGAFHGYSNDDSNLPKNQDNGYSLSRSRTQNNLTRSKTAEEGSDEWWASEKAKKLSPKRFDAGDIKFKQGPGILDGPLNAMGQNSKSNPHKEEHDTHKESPRSSPEISVKDTGDFEDSYNKNKGYKQQFSESKPFDSMMRQDISIEEAHSASANDQRGNFKSVMITPNNSLRQKHQNIVSAANESPASRAQSLMAMKAAFSSHGQPETDMTSKQHHTFEDKMMDDFLDMTLESDELGSSVLMGAAGAGLSGMSNNALQDRGLQLGLQSSSHPGQSLSMSNAQKLSSLGLQGGGGGMGTPGMNPHVMSPQMEFGAGGGMGLPMQGVQQGVLPGAGLGGHLERAGYQSGMPNVGNNSLFMGKSSSGSSQTERPLSGHAAGAMFPLHALQAGPAQAFPGGYSMLQPGQPPAPLADQWYYEDPDKNTQGPFSSREMYTWYRAGFFTPSLMVRRACEREMRPLGSYGHLVPFVDVLPPYPMAGYESRAPLNQSALGLAVMSMSNNDKPIPMPPSAQNAMQNSLQSAMQNKVEGSSMQGGHSPQLLASPIQMIQNAIIQNIGPASMPGAPHFANVALTRNGPHAQQNMFDSLWGQASPDVLWMQRNPPLENRVNNLPLCFWDQQPSAMASNSLLPEDITKEMKTEDQILAQLRANQSLSAQAGAPALAEPKPAASMAAPATSKPLDAFSTPITPTYFEELHKIIHKEPATTPATHSKESSVDTRDAQPPKQDKVNKPEQTTPEANIAKSQQNNATKETKSNKQSKTESDKTVKNKENNSTKSKNKKKDDKKDDAADVKVKEDNSNKSEPKRSVESSPVKYKKEDKTSKKDIEKEKKEWIKEGFTIVKGPEKSTTKDTKKKAEEAKIAEEADKKRKEEEKLAADDEKKKRIADAAKKQQEPQSLCTSKSSADCGGGGGGGGGGSVSSRKAWSSQSAAAPAQEHPTLAEIQRLEREKKLEQMREQQQMMQIIALQQAQQLAREQEMQANLAWAKKKTASQPAAGPSLAEIQAQEQVSRKQQLAAAPPPAPAPAPPEEERAPPAAPWGQPHNGGGFWDSPAPQAKAPEPKQQEPKPEVPKVVKKKAPAAAPVAGSAAPAVAPPAPPAPAAPAAPPAPPAPPKKVTTPAVEFDTWCTTTLKSWSSKIDVPTFIGFLKDIESPYEVKDYVRCYLGEARETADFARSFLERRSKLLRGGTVSPPDDLCSPALAVTPRAAALPDYADLKGKAKKTKKNKMLKVDARFLGFSATAAEDRINVGDIDTV